MDATDRTVAEAFDAIEHVMGDGYLSSRDVDDVRIAALDQLPIVHFTVAAGTDTAETIAYDTGTGQVAVRRHAPGDPASTEVVWYRLHDHGERVVDGRATERIDDATDPHVRLVFGRIVDVPDHVPDDLA